MVGEDGRDQGDALIYSNGLINRPFPCRDSVTRELVKPRVSGSRGRNLQAAQYLQHLWAPTRFLIPALLSHRP